MGGQYWITTLRRMAEGLWEPPGAMNMVSGETAEAKPMAVQCDAHRWEGCQARQVKAKCKQEEGDSLGYLDRVILCANTCGDHAQASANGLMLHHWTLLQWREES